MNTLAARRRALKITGRALWVLILVPLATVATAAPAPAGGTTTVTGTTGIVSTSTADVQVVRTAALTESPDQERVVTAAILPKGGFFAVTNIRGRNSFVYKTSDEGVVIWRKELLPDEAGAVPESAGISSDGGYWVAGTLIEKNAQPGQIHASDFVRRVHADGAVSERIVSFGAGDHYRGFHCAVEHENRFVQTATVDTLDEYFRMEVPSISMTDGNGARLWEHLIPLDQGRRIEEVPQQVLHCAGIFIAKNERILAAQQILVMPDLKTSDEIRRELGSGLHLRPGSLAIALDLAGNEVGRIRHDDVVGALLIPAQAGALLIETSYKKPSLSDLPGTIDQQVHIYSLDANLKELKPPITVEGSSFDTIDAAQPTPEGGLLLAGCPGSGGNVFLRYITPSGIVSPKRQFNNLGRCGGYYRFSVGRHPGEAMILVQTPGQGNRLLTLRYVN